MTNYLCRLRLVAVLAVAVTCALTAWPKNALAGTTGAITGTVRNSSSSAPIADVVVSAVSPSGAASATTDAHGFYNIPSLLPDTYTVSFSKSGYEPRSTAGVVVYADQTYRLDQSLAAALKQIAAVTARSAANLVQPGQTADVYNLSAQQFQAAQGADNLHKTLYQYLQSVPGVTISGPSGVPRIRGGNATGVAYELDGIPINDRLTGLFTTNLSNLGVTSVELYTGGYNARYGHAASGIINSTIKTGTYPSFATASFGITGPEYNHAMTLEFGDATPDRKVSYYVGFDGVNSANDYVNGKYTFPNVAIFGNDYIATDVYTRDIVANFHFRPNQNNDYQLLFQNGYGRFGFNYLLNGPFTPMQIVPCAGYVASNYTVASGGTSISGKPCVDSKGNPTGLQFIPVNPHNADVYHHYSGIGKLQWNHNFNDRLYGTFRLAENFNQYIFDQPYDDPNFANAIKPGDVALGGGSDNSAEDFYGDRRSNIWSAQYDLNWQANEDTLWYGGLSYEWDNDLQGYYDREGYQNFLGSAFNKDGSWPFQTLLVNYPLYLPSAYVGMKRTAGRWTVEPSIRYEHEDYKIPASAGGSYGLSAWEPRFALSYALNPSTVVRGSFTVTSAFIPAAYFFNNSVNGPRAYSNRVENPYAPGANVQPELDHNYDFSLEHQFPDGRTSLRVTPYYHQAQSKLAFYQNYTITNGVVHRNGPRLVKTNGEDKNFGVEVGLNHIEQGTNATSWFLSGTYLNSLSSSQVLTTAVTNFANLNTFLLNHTLYHPAGNPPVSVSLTMDFKRNRLHVDPYILYQCCAYYNVFGLDAPNTWFDAAGNVALTDTTIHRAPAFYWTQLSLSYDVMRRDDGHRTTVGLLVQNLNNVLHGPIPSQNVNYLNGVPGFSDGFLEQFAPGVVPNTAYAFTPDTQSPRSVELFVTFHM